MEPVPTVAVWRLPEFDEGVELPPPHPARAIEAVVRAANLNLISARSVWFWEVRRFLGRKMWSRFATWFRF